jgi:hypothetical protein
LRSARFAHSFVFITFVSSTRFTLSVSISRLLI